MYHWDMIIILLAALLWVCISLALAVKRSRWAAVKLILAALGLGIATELGAYSLHSMGDVLSPAWRLWLYFHLPASLALDPLGLPFETWRWVAIGLNSVIAAGLWHFGLERIQSRRGRRVPPAPG